MKKVIWVMALVLILGISSLGLAANSHIVTVTINSFARVSVTGSASVTIYDNDFVDGYANKDLNSTVRISVKTNKSDGCKVYASAANDFSATFPVSRLKAKVDTDGATYQSLATTPVELFEFSSKPKGNYPVLFKLEELPETEDAGTYNTTITYTAVVNS
ncbi:MAG: hypothetical protein GXY86_12210 [Firmicutes bacterium]|nr:hypothetical protein [Bacillota bacterium]